MTQRVLVACEFSGVVRDAFAKRGVYALSCDYDDTERPGEHYKGNVMDIINDSWDMILAFPPCTYLCVSGARWWAQRQREQAEAIAFVKQLMDADIDRIAIENPIGILTRKIGPPEQIVQPWQFGHGDQKSTCLWLKNLPVLRPTDIVDGRYPRVIMEPRTPDRPKNRSRTYQGIADAMAKQWVPTFGTLIEYSTHQYQIFA